MTVDKFKAGGGLSTIVIQQLSMLVCSDIMPFKLCIYLYSSISKLIFLYENILKKQRIDSMTTFYEELKKL